MADSGITKRALSQALKELMETQPFSKISIGDICEKCDMNRKSFYYHFRDKYDLVNWIYDTEFIAVARQADYPNAWALTEGLCRYFYQNRDFYRKTLDVQGQNSFSEYFKDIMMQIFTADIQRAEGKTMTPEALSFLVEFYADAVVCAIKKWLAQRNCMEPAQFTALLRQCLPGEWGKTEK